ncbi:hypothetical protein [Halorussus sp. MSC15.2]|uniref:hypothetical protein n=1 Tax=Halorussus sp. MSC15.2 TaxID=2283638 RepID=UPI0013D1C3A5|nr:hypothetical protein [Halorussus sp. MSC15.2]NEU56079.1 hypothetical protein [Halorussus sp. MSC15.2]
MTISLTAHDVRLPDLTALALLALTLAVGIAFYGDLPAEMVVGWHVGLDEGVRLTRAPRPVATFAVPAVATGAYVVVRAVALLPGVRDEVRAARFVYDLAANLLLVAFCASQMAVVTANL